LVVPSFPCCRFYIPCEIGVASMAWITRRLNQIIGRDDAITLKSAYCPFF
jgi:hypothetical protein